MLCFHLRGYSYNLSDSAVEDILIDLPTMRLFAVIDLSGGWNSDETTILAFHNVVGQHELSKQIVVTSKLTSSNGV